MYGGLVEFAGVLRDQLSNISRWLNSSIAMSCSMSRMPAFSTWNDCTPILQGSRKFASSSAELLQEICAEASVRGAYNDGLHELFAV